MLSDAGDAKGGVLGADTNDEHVVGNLGGAGGTLDVGAVYDGNDLAIRVDAGGLGFVVVGSALLVAQDGANGLHDGTVLNETRGARGQQRGEEEVVAGRDDNDIVVFGIEVLEKSDRAPAGALCVRNVLAGSVGEEKQMMAGRESERPEADASHT